MLYDVGTCIKLVNEFQIMLFIIMPLFFSGVTYTAKLNNYTEPKPCGRFYKVPLKCSANGS